jgi:TonB family protein
MPTESADPTAPGPQSNATVERRAFRKSLSQHIQGCQDALTALEGLDGHVPARQRLAPPFSSVPLAFLLSDAMALHPFLVALAGNVPRLQDAAASRALHEDLFAAFEALREASAALRDGTIPMAGDELDVDAMRANISAADAALRRADAALGARPVGFARLVGPWQPMPNKVRHVDPLYPDAARRMQIHGSVILELTIGPDGSVHLADILKSIPLLDQAALDAVRQWKFEPPLFNGMPTAVLAVESIRFSLQ